MQQYMKKLLFTKRLFAYKHKVMLKCRYQMISSKSRNRLVSKIIL